MLDKSEMIFGVRAVIEAIQAGKEIDKILVKKDIQSDLSKELFAACSFPVRTREKSVFCYARWSDRCT